MAMTITQDKLDEADLVLIVDRDGKYEWSAGDRSVTELVNVLHDIADDIEEAHRG